MRLTSCTSCRCAQTLARAAVPICMSPTAGAALEHTLSLPRRHTLASRTRRAGAAGGCGSGEATRSSSSSPAAHAAAEPYAHTRTLSSVALRARPSCGRPGAGGIGEAWRPTSCGPGSHAEAAVARANGINVPWTGTRSPRRLSGLLARHALSRTSPSGSKRGMADSAAAVAAMRATPSPVCSAAGGGELDEGTGAAHNSAAPTAVGEDATGPLARARVISIQQATSTVKVFWLDASLVRETATSAPPPPPPSSSSSLPPPSSTSSLSLARRCVGRLAQPLCSSQSILVHSSFTEKLCPFARV
jgi:hypothetical protein